MLKNYSVKGFKAFNKKVNFSFEANKKIMNKDYVFNFKTSEILKSAIIYGPNNTGKSSLIESINILKKIIKIGKIENNFNYLFNANFFDNEKEIEYEIEFIENNSLYKYELSFKENYGICKEILHIDNKLIFNRNEANEDEELNLAIDYFSTYKNTLMVSLLPKKYKKYTDGINSFFDKLIIINKFIDLEQILNDIVLLNKKEFNKFNKIIKSADISIDNMIVNEKIKNEEQKYLRLFSEYKMNNKRMTMPSYLADSDGTQVFMYYIIKILLLLKTGGVLIIDEIDKSLHTLLTKSIISLFNNEENMNIQLLATSHDLLLLDCLYLFRKDQVWFTYKDNSQTYLYSLNEYKANQDNKIRNNTMENYLKGFFGALPHPNIEEFIYDDK